MSVRIQTRIQKYQTGVLTNRPAASGQRPAAAKSGKMTVSAGRGGALRPAVEPMETASRAELGRRRRCPRLRRRRSKNARGGCGPVRTRHARRMFQAGGWAVTGAVRFHSWASFFIHRSPALALGGPQVNWSLRFPVSHFPYRQPNCFSAV